MIGHRYDMEIQAIYESNGDKQASNERAILSFLFKIEPGKHNDFLENLDLTRIPNVVATNPPFLSGDTSSISLSGMWVQDQKKYPDDFEYFYYEGSLTSPQCDEGVFWYVISDPFEIGNAYVTMISEALNDLPEVNIDYIDSLLFINS